MRVLLLVWALKLPVLTLFEYVRIQPPAALLDLVPQEPIVDPAACWELSTPCGMLNTGNSCSMNAILQVVMRLPILHGTLRHLSFMDLPCALPVTESLSV